MTGEGFSFLGLLTAPSTPLWVVAALVFAGLLRFGPQYMAQANERARDKAAQMAGDWTRLRDEVDRLARRVEALETKVEECEQDRDNWRHQATSASAELARRDAIELGLGQARQQAQAAVSADRLEQRDLNDRKKP